jgi:hypothetical protein
MNAPRVVATALLTDGAGSRGAREDVQLLAKQTGHVIALAQKVYDAELDKLRKDAKVTEFAAILALRHTRERLLALQKNRSASGASANYELFSA